MQGKVFLVLAVAACFYLGQVIATPACDSGDAGALVEKCRMDLLQAAGHNFTEDCENGIMKDFMRCVNAVQGCTNLSDFTENTISEHYGCMDTDIIVQKRSWVRRLVCRVACSFSCSYVCSGFLPCSYVCSRVCRPVCEYVWRWISDRFGRDLSEVLVHPRDLSDEEQQYMLETENLCSNCVCRIDVPERANETALTVQVVNSAARASSVGSLLIALIFPTVAALL